AVVPKFAMEINRIRLKPKPRGRDRMKTSRGISAQYRGLWRQCPHINAVSPGRVWVTKKREAGQPLPFFF
ncbi:MAG: hypothetical protein ACXWR4_20970, partial [Bdellovibrionota bacterium]